MRNYYEKIITFKTNQSDLPKLNKLPIVNSAANFLDFNKIIGVIAKALSNETCTNCSNNLKLTKAKQRIPKPKHKKNPIIRSFLL